MTEGGDGGAGERCTISHSFKQFSVEPHSFCSTSVPQYVKNSIVCCIVLRTSSVAGVFFVLLMFPRVLFLVSFNCNSKGRFLWLFKAEIQHMLSLGLANTIKVLLRKVFQISQNNTQHNTITSENI